MDGRPALWVLDLGNTRLKLGRFVGTRLAEAFTYPRARAGEALDVLLAEPGDAYAVLSTGALAEEAAWRERLGAAGPVWSYEPGAPTVVEVAYATPGTLGTDRLAAAAGARALYGGRAALVVDVGTCITYELIDPAGVYRGGAISPGPAMRLDAMHQFTGRLPRVREAAPGGFPGGSTAAALLEGGVAGAAHEVAGFVASFRADHPGGAVVACGGGFALLRPLLPAGIDHRPHLVLEGLATMHAYAHAQ